MKKTRAPSVRELGAGLFIAGSPPGSNIESDSSGKTKPVPNNAGKKYFRWTMQARNMLLRECSYREVWCFPHKKKMELWQEIAVILKSIPNFETTLEKLDGRKCQDEFATNLDLYNQHKDSWRFQSGSDEQHTEWQDIMETITQQMGAVAEHPPDQENPTRILSCRCENER